MSEDIDYEHAHGVACCELAELQAKVRGLEAELAAERLIVAKIWEQLGSPSYDELKGRSIYDLIDEMGAERDALRELLREIVEYSGGVDHALADEYVIARIDAALAKGD